MTDDPRFEDDVRDALTNMTRDPVPPRVVARVAGIPTNAPGRVAARVGMAGSSWRLSGALAAVFVVVVLVAGAFLLRGTGPGTVASPSPSGLPGTALSSTTPLVGPTDGPVLGTPATGDTVRPTAAPGVALPADFQPRSVTFASPTEGWALGTTACGSAKCAAIAHTLDAGRTWSRIPAPATSVAGGPGFPVHGVSAIRFADPLDGWVYAPDLWATHDGGKTWTAVDVAQIAGGTAIVWDLEAAAGTAHMAYDVSSPLAFGIASTPVARDAWKSTPVFLPVGAGPVPRVQLVIQGTAGWLIQVDREVIDGARLANGSWQPWTPPCGNAAGPAVLAASSTQSLIADCDLGVWSTPAGEHLYRSVNGGGSFAELSPAVPLTGADEVATPNTSTIVAAGDSPLDAQGATTPVVIASFDGGHTWTTVLRPGLATFTDLGFTTQTQGVLITSVGATSRLLMTRDGGHSWAAVVFSCAPGMFCSMEPQ